ncbi:MAG TPA: hypothetical protein VFN10_15925, partial [Thermoanaerobaculia bacterium]|nr:hypothetical protein [Thermoanaerobaculia bacterium]
APGATTTGGEAPAAPTVTQEAIPAASEVTVAAEAVPEAPANPEPTHVIEATTEDAELSAQEAADSFITYETERITNIINASAAIGDENVKSKIFEACTQRLQLLSNLRLLIEGAGTKSRLAGAAREAQSESERVALVAKLFGHSIGPHWAPKDAADVVVDVPSELASEPERVLRDTSGRVGDEDKRRALYVLLSRAQPTEEQRLWLTTIIDRFLQ